MESILKWLFSSDLCIGREEKEERNLAKEGAAVMEAAEKLSAGLPPELHQAWRNYKDQVERFQDLERQNEFERGFVVAVFLMLELINKGNQAGTTNTEYLSVPKTVAVRTGWAGRGDPFPVPPLLPDTWAGDSQIYGKAVGGQVLLRCRLRSLPG